MTWAVIVSDEALADLDRLAVFLADRDPAAARRAVRRPRGAILSLRDKPRRGRPGSREDLREMVVPFGQGVYVVRYRVGADQVIVARIFHGLEDRG